MSGRALVWSRRTLFASTLFNALLAGLTIDRYFVQRPAFEHLGPIAWGAYSRVADLGPGLILYPVLGAGGALFTIATAVLISMSRTRPLRAALPIYGATLLIISALAGTLKAAPIMLGVASVGNDPHALQLAFDGFVFWSAIRGACQVSAFVMCLVGLVNLYAANASDV